MDLKFIFLMMMLVTTTSINYSSRLPDFHTHWENGSYDDHMAAGLTPLQPHSHYEDLVLNERNLLEEGHQFPLWTDVQALLSFKKDIKDPSGKLSNWTIDNSKEACSSWYGINCSQHTPRVVAIVLPGLNLTGTLSPSIGSLSSLHTLNISYNFLGGEIPPEFRQLKALRILDLGGGRYPIYNGISFGYPANNFTGTVPTEFGHLVELEHLDLRSNSLGGHIPSALGNCTKLRYLDLSTNNFTGTIAMEFGRLTKLEYLDFHSNFLSGHLPPTLGNCTKLQYISLLNNSLLGKIPRRFFPNSLKVIEMSENFLSGDLDLVFPVSLNIFSVFSNNFSGLFPPSLANCRELKLINLRKNNLTGELPKYITSFKKLRVLSISYNKFYGVIFQNITILTKLFLLDLSNNKLSGRIPMDIKLQGFAVNFSKRSDCRLQYEIEITMKRFEYILSYVLPTNTILDLSSNNLKGEIPTSIGSLTCLRLLNLSWNQLEGEIPTSLGAISTLEQLDLSNNNLSGRIPEELSKLYELAVANFSFNNLCGSIPKGERFTTFSRDSFQRNRCLCGSPLPTCKLNKSRPMGGVNGKSNAKIGWLHHVDENISLITLGIGVPIGFGGVVIVFIFWNRARDCVVPPNKPKLFYGEYRLPT